MDNKAYGGFEVYSRPVERFIDKISITEKGRVGFNKSIDAKYNLRQYDRGILYWNKVENEIGIEFVKGPIDQQTVKLLVDPRGYGAHFNARNFFLTYGINLEAVNGQYNYRRVPLRKYGINRDGYMLIVRLLGD